MAEPAAGPSRRPLTGPSGLTSPPDHVLRAIYGEAYDKQKAYDHSLTRWWTEYSDRKNDEEDEHVADSLLYDRNHLPRMAPPPECVFEARKAQLELQQQQQQGQQQQQQQAAPVANGTSLRA